MRTRYAAPLLALLLATASAAGAQIGNQSDHTGPIVTGGSMIGFIPGRGAASGRSAALIEDRGVISYGSARVSCAVSATGDSTLAMLRGGTLPLIRQPAQPADAAEKALAALVSPSVDKRTEPAEFAVALARHADGTQPDAGEALAARALADALESLMPGSASCSMGAGSVPAPKLAASFAAYDAFLNAASPQVLQSPSPEMLAVQALLDRLARAALGAAQ
ncbi:MAG TPA: hypothetical protein VFH27_00635 [Longimicrobiaceae bacterium]|nr:hypothetical protein [Longimicrobiaceae bacterium]